MLNFDLKDISGSSYLSRDMYRPSSVHTNMYTPHSGTASSPQIKLAIEESYALARSSLMSPSFLPVDEKLVKIARRVNLAERISGQTSIFGAGMLVSVSGVEVTVTLVHDSADSVFQNVFASVLTGSRLLDLQPAHGEEQYTFLKEEPRFSNDWEELERLSGSYNVSKTGLRGGGSEVCVRGTLPPFSVCLLYGANVERVRRHTIRQEHRAAVKAAWRQEAERVSMGFHGAWTASERDEILKVGSVRGYTGEMVHSVHKFPALIGQASNIVFKRIAQGQGSYIRK